MENEHGVKYNNDIIYEKKKLKNTLAWDSLIYVIVSHPSLWENAAFQFI